MAFLCCSLVMMGTLFWVDNSWAFFPDNDPTTTVDISILITGQAGDDFASELDPDGNGQIPLSGGKLLRGNGDRDDNRQEPIVIICGTGELVAPNSSEAQAFFQSHREVKSYLDFGHLKIFPDVQVAIIVRNNCCYRNKAVVRLVCDSLFFKQYMELFGLLPIIVILLISPASAGADGSETGQADVVFGSDIIEGGEGHDYIRAGSDELPWMINRACVARL